MENVSHFEMQKKINERNYSKPKTQNMRLTETCIYMKLTKKKKDKFSICIKLFLEIQCLNEKNFSYLHDLLCGDKEIDLSHFKCGSRRNQLLVKKR